MRQMLVMCLAVMILTALVSAVPVSQWNSMASPTMSIDMIVRNASSVHLFYIDTKQTPDACDDTIYLDRNQTYMVAILKVGNTTAIAPGNDTHIKPRQYLRI